ncbi:MAG TPA: GGDEF domain-containing protein [Solirubrobacteraceae bacterium]|nr:GGDEF domain-containing protein [Solirubrobacteraceae bacterium]
MSDPVASVLPSPVHALRPAPSLAAQEPAPPTPSAPDSAPVSWLISDGMDRERMLDMDRLVAPVRRKSFMVMTVALLVCGPWLGWWTIALLAVAGVLFKVADDAIGKVTHPEYLLFAAWAGSQLMIALAVVLTGGPRSPAMAWFAIPIVTLSARFPARGVVLGLGVTVVMMVAVAFGSDAGAVLARPPLLIMPLGLSIAVAILSTALMRSDVAHRSEAVIDPLTGMLNRNSLKDRTLELAHQSERTGQPVGLIVGDLDHFKQVNDNFGHATGDAVLQDVAYLLRKQLRAFDLAYRIGGEEFLVLLPGANREQAEAMAERLRLGVQADTVGGGLRVTMSFGVSASRRERAFDYQQVCEEADAALYEAKRAGRNRVCTSGVSSPEHRPAAA